jgi:hypothetical protein
MARASRPPGAATKCRGLESSKGSGPFTTRNHEWFGARYRIDLCDRHAEAFKAALAPWIDRSQQLTRRLLPEPRVAPPAGLYDKVIPLPGPEATWKITPHAHDRMVERHVSVHEARRVAQWPASQVPSRKDPNLVERFGDGLGVVVDPWSRTIITVVRPEDGATT